MNPFQIIATLRKFGNFLVGLFPWLTVIADVTTGTLLKLTGLLMGIGWISTGVLALQKQPAVKGLQSVFKRFYWRDYSKDRLSLDDVPADSVAILRPVFLVSTLLCLLIPALMLPSGGTVPIETFSGHKHDAPLWSVLLWFAGAVVAWSALLVGTAVSNRLAFLTGGLGYAYLFGSIVACTAKSPSNVFIPLSILLAIFVHEKACQRPGAANAIFGLINAAALGAASGIYFFAATTIKMPATTSSLVISIPGGITLGLLVFALARLKSTGSNRLMQKLSSKISTAKAFYLTAALSTINLCFLAARCTPAKVASHLISLTHLTESYAWPVWYLLAVGIILKLIKNSDVVAKAATDITGLKLLRPVTVALITAALATVYCEKALSWFTPSSPFYFISDTALHVYTWTRSWFWKEPIFAFSAPYIGAVLLFDVICMMWLIGQRRFSNALAGRFLYLTILAWFVISEYTFEVLSLARSPGHSVVALMLFAIWLLWLMHTIGLALSTRSSRFWPSAGRLPIYGSVLIFALLEIHSRGALQDYKITNELFLIMERGIIDVGLPYFLWVYTTRRFSELPVNVATVFCIFCAGALLTLPLNTLDKLSICNWDWHQFLALNATLTEKYLATGNLQYEANMHWGWLLVKTAIFCLLLWGTTLLSWRVVKPSPQRAMIVTFILVSFAGGIASFSKGFLDLGLPPALAVATAPLTLDLLLSQRVLVTYFMAWIPALLIGLALQKVTSSDDSGREKLPAQTGVYLALGFALSALLRIAFFCYEDFLQSTGAMIPLLSLYGMLFSLLVLRLVDTAGDATVEEEKRKNQRDLRKLMAIAACSATIWMTFTIAGALGSVRDITSIPVHLQVPGEFRNQIVADTPNSKATVFTTDKAGTDKSYLVVGKVNTEGLEGKALLAHLLQKAVLSGQFPELKVVQVEPWQSRYAGALACTYTYNIMLKQKTGTLAVPMTGITVLLPPRSPQDNAAVSFVTAYTPPAELDLRRWQLAWITDQLNRVK
ncbi:MAG: hypothetical protein JSS83_24600 [Cyanobacteria bacterium SZAS LIN-3]|nr:hypothetical protein [Cyanobacteria bacterium SZAS LIN-3]